MIDIAFANEQLRRLKSMKYFPSDEAAQRELVMACAVADTYDICHKVIGEMVCDSSECPAPADIRRMIYAENERHAERRKKTKCPICGGTGFISGIFLVTKHFDGERSWTSKQRIESEPQRAAIVEALKRNAALPQHQQKWLEIMEASEPCQCHAINTSEDAA
jgi:hypothetical protein